MPLSLDSKRPRQMCSARGTQCGIEGTGGRRRVVWNGGHPAAGVARGVAPGSRASGRRGTGGCALRPAVVAPCREMVAHGDPGPEDTLGSRERRRAGIPSSAAARDPAATVGGALATRGGGVTRQRWRRHSGRFQGRGVHVVAGESGQRRKMRLGI